ncbi:MAG: hypothetical protein ACI9LG_002604 [Moritella dasanensis]|jgi:uncharacterized protein YgfB (UPF0149 family)|uniref:UPF0149 family protein n=1 Tax=Moritella dasanensis TaxID=428031 RepID=UPI0002FB0F5A|nr:UPF0149 family protein [Moritella dasanensis]
MDKVKLPLFADVNEQLQQSDLLVNPADVHGVICGLLCGGVKLDSKAWLEPFDQLINEGLGIPDSLDAILADVYSGSEAALKDMTLGFELLLPDMDQPLENRMEALAEWVQGFLGGFGMVHSVSTVASDDVKELIADFASISQMDIETDDDSNEAEESFYEIVEYVRMGATYCFNELGDGGGEAQAMPILH